MRRLLASLAIISGLLATTVAVAPAAQADQQNCIVSGGYVECLFTKSSLTFVSSKWTTYSGAKWMCGYTQVNFYNSSGTNFWSITSGRICSSAPQFNYWPPSYVRTNTRRVCARWNMESPDLPWSYSVCRTPPW